MFKRDSSHQVIDTSTMSLPMAIEFGPIDLLMSQSEIIDTASNNNHPC